MSSTPSGPDRDQPSPRRAGRTAGVVRELLAQRVRRPAPQRDGDQPRHAGPVHADRAGPPSATSRSPASVSGGTNGAYWFAASAMSSTSSKCDAGAGGRGEGDRAPVRRRGVERAELGGQDRVGRRARRTPRRGAGSRSRGRPTGRRGRCSTAARSGSQPQAECVPAGHPTRGHPAHGVPLDVVEQPARQHRREQVRGPRQPDVRLRRRARPRSPRSPTRWSAPRRGRRRSPPPPAARPPARSRCCATRPASGCARRTARRGR